MPDPASESGLTIVIPIYNEEGVLWENAAAIAAMLDTVAGPDNWRFLFADNGSTDGTAGIVDRIIEKWPLTEAIRLQEPNFGEALRAGLMAVNTTWSLVTPIDEIDPPFVAWCWANRERYDLMIGSKRADPTLNHQQSYRRLLSWGLNAVIQLLCEFTGSDTHGMKFIRTDAVRPHFDACRLRRGQFDTELVLRAFRAGLPLIEVPTPYHEQRPSRNLMITKIGRNIVDVYRLQRLMRDIPYSGKILYYRKARVDLERAAEAVASANEPMARPETRSTG